MTRTLLLFGAGPGIGNHVAAAFASAGLSHIVLLARNSERLQNTDAAFVSSSSTSSSVKVSTLRVDLADLSSLPNVLTELDRLTDGEDVEIVYFNAARIVPNEVLGVDVGTIEEDFKTSTLSLYLIAQHFLPRLQTLSQSHSSTSKPALLVTSSHLPWDPIPQLLSLSLTKAAQRNMVQSFSRAFSDKGVHVGIVNVEGQVAEGNRVLNPKTIAERVVGFWEKGVESGWEVSIKEE